MKLFSKLLLSILILIFSVDFSVAHSYKKSTKRITKAAKTEQLSKRERNEIRRAIRKADREIITAPTNANEHINAILDIAESMIGQREKRNNSGFRNRAFERAMKSVGWRKGQAWCAYFVKWVMMEAAKANEASNLARKYARHLSGSVRNSWKKLDDSQHFLTRQWNAGRAPLLAPQVGDIVLWRSKQNSAFGHAGIVVEVGDGYITTIEGNTSEDGGRDGVMVARKTRSLNGEPNFKLWGYVRPKAHLFQT